MKLRNTILCLTVAGVAGFASPAMAYVGPGAGLSVVGALVGVLMAVGAALAFIVGWPIRRMMRRRKLAQAQTVPPDEARSSSAR